MHGTPTTRRRLLRGLAGVGASTLVAAWSRARAQQTTLVGHRCYLAFREALAEERWLGAFRSVDQDILAPVAMSLEGRVPKGLAGTLYRNGPAGLERDKVRYQHWFDGDGMIQAFRVTERGVVHHGRKVRTEKLEKETRAGRFLYAGAGSQVPNPVPPGSNDSGNPANISVVPYDRELLALWEAGSPHALAADTLETRRRVVWSKETARLPFSAHPVVELDGSLWNFGLVQWMQNGRLILYRIEPGRGLVRTANLELPFPGYMHSFAATERWLVFYLSPNVMDRERTGTYVARHRWRPELGGRILLVDKADFSKRRWFEAPAGFVFHLAGAADETNGGVRFTASWAEHPKIMNETMGRMMCGDAEPLYGRVVMVRVPPRGPVRLEPYDVDGEFPMVDRRFQSRARSRWVFLATREGSAPWLNAVATCDTRSGLTTRYRFPGQTVVEEHRFVPRTPGAGEGDGWLVGTNFDARAQRTFLTVFDSQRVADGPILTARMNRSLPLGFHGWFSPA